MSILGFLKKPSSQSMSAIMDSIPLSSTAKKHGQEAVEVAWKLARITGKAAWIAGNTFLVLGLPLIFVMDQEAALSDMIQNEQDAMGLILGTTS